MSSLITCSCRKEDKLRASESSATDVSTSQPGGFKATKSPAHCSTMLGSSGSNSLDMGERRWELDVLGHDAGSLSRKWAIVWSPLRSSASKSFPKEEQNLKAQANAKTLKMRDCASDSLDTLGNWRLKAD